MDKLIFFAPDIRNHNILPSDESNHCVKVLRKKEGDKILITDGKGYFFDAEIIDANSKNCEVHLLAENLVPKSWTFELSIAFAPTKNMDRIEWFIEKATEIGIDRLIPILCKNSERKYLKTDRLHRVMVSAIKQSQKAILPQLDEMVNFEDFVKQPFQGQKFIAHCYDTEKSKFSQIYRKGESALILIGPEGDFSLQEVAICQNYGFEPISLIDSRLRTETAALFACNGLQILNI